MTRFGRFTRDASGQTLVIVALSFVTLLGAVALALDWGYGLTQRRVMVSSAEAGALAGAKLLAMSVVTDAQGVPGFTVVEEYVYCVALDGANANREYQPEAERVETTVVEWNTEPQRRDADTGEPIYTAFAEPVGGCPTPGTPIATGTPTNPEVRYVRVRTSVSYRPLLATVLGQSSITAMGAGAGAARIVGTPPPEAGPTWPLLRHYNENDFNTECDAVDCDPVIFWSSNDQDLVYGNKKGLVNFSRYSPIVMKAVSPGYVCPDADLFCVPQLMTEWDRRGELPDVTGNSCSPPAEAGMWLTTGNESPANYDKGCSIPNWAYHLFGGTLSLESDYSGIAWNGIDEFREKPSDLSQNRQVCNTTIPVQRPSCGSDPDSPITVNVGDWVDFPDTGNLGVNVADALRRYIDERQQVDEFFFRPTPTGNGIFGYYAVIPIYLWDCAETYDGSLPPGEQWSLTLPKTSEDCSDIHRDNDLRSGHSVDRVHVFTVVPFTFYRGLVASSEISGFWGGKIGDSLACQAVPTPPDCELNAVSNGVFLVPPD